MRATDLTTAAAVRGIAQINTADIASGLLDMLIGAVSTYVVTRCGRDNLNLVASVTDILDGSGSDKQFLTEYPVRTVTSVTVGGFLLAPSPDGVTAGYTFDDNALVLLGSALLGSGGIGRFPRGRRNVKVVYTAGYDATSRPAADPNYNGAPSDLGQAVTWLVAQTYKRRDWLDQASKSLAAGETISFQSWRWPPFVDAVFEAYRRSWY